MNFICIFGYIATVVTVSSFLFKNMTKLRIVSTIGCILFIVYGVIKMDYPIIIVNFSIAIINLCNLGNDFFESMKEQDADH